MDKIEEQEIKIDSLARELKYLEGKISNNPDAVRYDIARENLKNTKKNLSDVKQHLERVDAWIKMTEKSIQFFKEKLSNEN